MIRVTTSLMSLALLAGCASDWDRGQERWSRLSALDSPYSRWTGCIRDRSYRYLDRVAGPDPATAAENDAQLFTRVLADCRELMSGEAWANLRDGEVRQRIADAYQAFGVARADIMDRNNRAIETGTDAQN